MKAERAVARARRHFAAAVHDLELAVRECERNGARFTDQQRDAVHVLRRLSALHFTPIREARPELGR